MSDYQHMLYHQQRRKELEQEAAHNRLASKHRPPALSPYKWMVRVLADVRRVKLPHRQQNPKAGTRSTTKHSAI